MKSNREIRRQTWKIISGRWFMRLLVVGFVLQAIAMTANGLLTAAFKALSITQIPDYLQMKLAAMQQGIDYSLPTFKAFVWMITGFSLQTFISYVFAAIAAFGMIKALLQAHDNVDNRWFSNSFGGFLHPLGLCGLMFLQNLFVMLWGLLFIIPGIIALYRYRLAWFIRAENDNFSAIASLRGSCRMMRGYKIKAFLLDLSFIGWILLTGALIGAAAVLGACGSLLTAFLSFFVGIAGFYLFVRTIIGIAVSRAVFYRELLQEAHASDGQEATAR